MMAYWQKKRHQAASFSIPSVRLGLFFSPTMALKCSELGAYEKRRRRKARHGREKEGEESSIAHSSKTSCSSKKKKKNQTVRDKCFAKCITKPSNSLSSGEQTCLSRCCDRYSDATQAVLKSVLEHSGLS